MISWDVHKIFFTDITYKCSRFFLKKKPIVDGKLKFILRIYFIKNIIHAKHERLFSNDKNISY